MLKTHYSLKYRNDHTGGENLNYDDNNFTLEEDEQFQELLEYANRESNRNKTFVLNPNKIALTNEVLKNLKLLLKENGFDYKLYTERLECFPTQALINLTIESFGVCAKDYNMFKNIINSIDSYSISSLKNGDLEISMAIQNMFIEI